MKFKEVASRITGFNVPVFGISWNPPEPEIAIARRVLAFLEDRRVLFNPFAFEVTDHCEQSVIEIRQFLTQEIGGFGDDSQLARHLRSIRAACRRFLDSMSPGAHRVIRPFRTGPLESQFFTNLGELRATIGLHIGAIALMHGLDVEGELASALPAIDEQSDSSERQRE